jgi:hypothetical protein
VSGLREAETAARAAAAAAARLAAARVADIPLGACPQPLAQLGATVSQLSDGLFRAAGLAEAMTGPGQPETEGAASARASLLAACRRAVPASEHLGSAANAIRRDLMTTGTGAADASPRSPLARYAADALEQAALLDRALRVARMPDPCTPHALTLLAQTARDQAQALTEAGRACGMLCDAITAAYDQRGADKADRAAAPLLRAASSLQRAATMTAQAAGALGDAYLALDQRSR